VATEAQISGIPVIASARGGLPEAVGPGGILIDPKGPLDDWVKAVQKLWQDKAYYDELSIAALNYAQRPELSVAYQMGAYEQALQAACGKKSNLLS
jgi:glycosyltransferase involved in cell wall biosynthesis